MAATRIKFPQLEIITGTWIDNLANIGPLILAGANGITKFPLFKMFGTIMVGEWRRKLNGLEESLKGHLLISISFKWVKAICLTWNHLLEDTSTNVLNNFINYLY